MIVIVMVVAVALGACGKKASVSHRGSASSPTSAPAATSLASSPSPTRTHSSATCNIVSAAEVNAALGTAVTAPQVNGTNPLTVCTYSGGTPLKAVIVRFQTGEDPAIFASGKAGFNSNGQATTDVSGYGDEAYSSLLQGAAGTIGVSTLVARKGDVEVLITAPTALAPVGVLMEKVLSQV